ncbi:MAG: NAD-dependent epimerase/dehydratase family protein [Saprospiraceae bacterium]|nr:NAD-dependent epimerase/dehydratase family protein [Saprospiraceae bacterium]
MIKIGITGQHGFIGTSLYNTLGLFPDKYFRVSFQKEYFNAPDKFDDFVRECDVIVHLAAVNRHSDLNVLYQSNIELVETLTASLKRTNSKASVLFSSSTQEENDNLYGRSKREGRKIFEKWAQEEGGKFFGLIIPNVFGPFGRPFYNSVVATFCHQLNQKETPQIQIDSLVNLIYVGDLVSEIIDIINIQSTLPEGFSQIKAIESTTQITVSELLSLLQDFKGRYLDKGEIPHINNSFELNLFNTFRSFIPNITYFPVHFIKHSDPRGSFSEVIRSNNGGQTSFSITKPGITRGNHFHTRKIERFAVVQGKARIQLRRIGTGDILNFDLDGEQPAYVDMPIWYSHNITNTGSEELITIFWINEFYNPEDPDTYFENV